MKKSAGTIAMVLFIALAIVVTITAGGNSNIFPVAKALLIPALIVLVYLHSETINNKNLVATGLFFSWMGDILLLFESKGALFFIGGLISFLITHIFYIIYFLKIKSPQRSLLRNQPWIAALVG
jgi:uncharacterized membrane protein YhhN